jgi:CTP-dependent riboflavin kinase
LKTFKERLTFNPEPGTLNLEPINFGKFFIQRSGPQGREH